MPAIIIPGEQVAYGDSGSTFGAKVTTATTASLKTILPAGWNLINTGLHTTIQATVDAGTTFITLLPVSSNYTYVWCDGQTIYAVNDSTGGTSAIYYPVAGP